MSRRSRHKNAGNKFVEPDLPITPMLDMSFQLLAYFLMTFNPTPTEGHIDVGLPNQAGGPSSALPNPLDPDVAEEITIKISADELGDIDSIALAVGKDGGEVAIPGKGRQARAALNIDLKKRLDNSRVEHKTRMERIGENKPFQPAKLKLELAERLSYKVLIAVMDEAGRAGYPSIAPVLKEDKK
jgi:biopolymer transport protein ExbD